MSTRHIIFSYKGMLRSSTRAFTLIETLVSTFIITMVILGPLTVATDASSYARVTKDTVTAAYLAQEAIELLRHQQDSIYLHCIQGTDAFCVPDEGESYSDAAWRIFKNRLNNQSSVSCFSNENTEGCAFDVLDMTVDEDVAPVKYRADQTECENLSIEDATLMYVCSGAHGSGVGYTPTTFSRVIFISSIPTIGQGTNEAVYNDDLRITVTVTFKRPNGYQHRVQIVDFLHPRA